MPGKKTKKTPYFPKYLNKGTKHPSVFMLQGLLIAGGFNSNNIIINGDYSEKSPTTRGVEILQAHVGVERDGNFGPMTRKAWHAKGGPDVNTIMKEDLLGE